MPTNYKRREIVLDFNDLTTIDDAIVTFDRARERLANIDEIMKAARLQFMRHDVRELLRELKKTGRRRRKGEKVRWTSDRQRRYVMRLLGGRPYVRNNQLVGSWVVRVRRLDNERSLFYLTNRKPWVRFVVGAWGTSFKPRDIKYYEHFQQGFHADMDWPLAWKPIKAAADLFAQRHTDLFDNLFATLFDSPT